MATLVGGPSNTISMLPLRIALHTTCCRRSNESEGDGLDERGWADKGPCAASATVAQSGHGQIPLSKSGLIQKYHQQTAAASRAKKSNATTTMRDRQLFRRFGVAYSSVGFWSSMRLVHTVK
ncbi:MAG: hypothetical protein JWL69_4204 [Phycisphaerales bacterium]|jgi:hypothetical protein|nr:hypothetical protein [Phycisphaerales bacterium]